MDTGIRARQDYLRYATVNLREGMPVMVSLRARQD
jgi:hypothetical protein